VRYALDVGIDAIAERTPALGSQLRDGLEQVDGVRVLDRGSERCAIVTFTVRGRAAETVHSELQERGVNASVSYRGYALYDFDDKAVDACVRLSPHYYNTEEEVAVVVEAVRAIAAGTS
jgi:selenocysteine lyase/cysteine desulfurase